MSAVILQLPTAAPRKVRQSPSRTTAADRKVLARFPDIYTTPLERRAQAKAETLLQMEMTPAMALAVAMFQTMETVDQWKAQLFLAQVSEAQPNATLALAYAEFVTATPNERRAINRRLKQMQGRP